MATTPKKKKPRNMSDSTLRLHRALVKRLTRDEDFIAELQQRVAQLEKRR